jgi:D-xylose transport system ATP-binding protein
MTADSPPVPVLKARQISKYFGSVLALDDVDLEVHQDEVVGLVGDNGAGKSTLIKILSGNFPPDSGTLELDGNQVRFKSPADARALGIETVYQDLALCENLDAAANFFIGRELYRRRIGFRVLRTKDMETQATETLSRVGTHIPSVRERVEFLSGGERQSVALARFVAWGDKLVLLDEPTAALGVRETRSALDLVERVRRDKHIAMVFISHNLDHVFRIADRIIVMRHGRIAGVRDRLKTSLEEVVAMITGPLEHGNQSRR